MNSFVCSNRKPGWDNAMLDKKMCMVEVEKNDSVYHDPISGANLAWWGKKIPKCIVLITLHPGFCILTQLG